MNEIIKELSIALVEDAARIAELEERLKIVELLLQALGTEMVKNKR